LDGSNRFAPAVKVSRVICEQSFPLILGCAVGDAAATTFSGVSLSSSSLANTKRGAFPHADPLTPRTKLEMAEVPLFNVFASSDQVSKPIYQLEKRFLCPCAFQS